MMAKIYRWDSELLQNYGTGDLIALADSADETRAKLRAGLDDWLKEHRQWEWAEAHGLWGGEIDTESLDRSRALFEQDIAAEPTEHETLWITGSE